MTIAEFVSATGRLETYFAKEYTQEQLKIMHEELKDYELTRYKQLISLAIKECKYLPKVADFTRIDSENPAKKNLEEIEKIECKKCGSTGCIPYTKKIKNGTKDLYYTYASVCDCGNIKQYKGWEMEEKENRSDYYMPLAKELGLI